MDITLTGQDFPDIQQYLNNGNPTLRSPNSVYEIGLFQTKESLTDIDSYARFINNAISQFRKSRFYTAYKSYLYSLGMNHCAFMHNINSDIAEIEMHHTIITIFDIALMICEHYLNTYGYVTTFHIVAGLRDAHKNNVVPLVMLSKTAHQLIHNDELFYVHPNQIFGDWFRLFATYPNGITTEICSKVLYYIRNALKEKESNDNDLLTIANTITDWSNKTYGSVIQPINNPNPYTFWSNSGFGNSY